jgi:hypothetical protein
MQHGCAKRKHIMRVHDASRKIPDSILDTWIAVKIGCEYPWGCRYQLPVSRSADENRRRTDCLTSDPLKYSRMLRLASYTNRRRLPRQCSLRRCSSQQEACRSNTDIRASMQLQSKNHWR